MIEFIVQGVPKVTEPLIFFIKVCSSVTFGTPCSFRNALSLDQQADLSHRRSQEARLPPPPPPNQNATNDKNVTKQPCFFSFSF